MLEFTIEELSQWVGQYLWPFFRIAAFFQLAPIFGTQIVPLRIRLLCAVAVSILVIPMLPVGPQFEGITINAMFITTQQIIIGLAMAMVMQFLFQVFMLGGQLIAMQTGLGMSQMVDPTSGVSVAVVGQFYLILSTLLFVSMNGHILMIELLVESFRTIPVAEVGLPTAAIWKLVTSPSWVFSSALLLSLPPITAILIINITFGVITKAAPQMNIFSIGFPATLLLGLLVMWVSLGGFLPIFEDYYAHTFMQLRELIGA